VLTTSIYSEWTRWDCDAVLEEELSRDTEAVPSAHKSESSSGMPLMQVMYPFMLQ